MKKNQALINIQKKWQGSLSSYLFGFIISLLLTGAAYFLVITQFFTDTALVFTVIGLGILQAIAQLLFFLHIGKVTKPYWESIVFFSMILVLIIIVTGTLWVMFDLNSRMMPTMTEMTHVSDVPDMPDVSDMPETLKKEIPND